MQIGPSGSFDRGMVVILSFGALGGVVAGIRFGLLPWGDETDPRLGGTFDESRIWAGYGQMWRDYLVALAVWLVGSIVAAILGFIDRPSDSTVLWVFPVVLGLIWSIAYGVGLLATGLVAIPIVILLRGAAARSRGRKLNPWWYFVAVYLLVLVGAVGSFVVLILVAPHLLDGYEKGDLFALIFQTDAAALGPAQAVTLWVTRALVALMGALVVVTAILADRRRRMLKRPLGG